MTDIACRGVLFDNDGVLVDSTVASVIAWQEWAARFGVPEDSVLETIHGRRAADTVRAFVPAADVDRAVELIDSLELDGSPSTVAVRGAVELTASIAEDGWAVVTSGNRALATARLEAAGLTPPAVLVSAWDVEHGKPAPDGYLRAAAALGLDPSDCVVLEDSANGVAAARAAEVGFVLGVGEDATTIGADAGVLDLNAVTWSPAGLHVAD